MIRSIAKLISVLCLVSVITTHQQHQSLIIHHNLPTIYHIQHHPSHPNHESHASQLPHHPSHHINHTNNVTPSYYLATSMAAQGRDLNIVKDLLDKRIEQFPDQSFVKRNGKLFCQACNKKVAHKRKTAALRHCGLDEKQAKEGTNNGRDHIVCHLYIIYIYIYIFLCQWINHFELRLIYSLTNAAIQGIVFLSLIPYN